MAKMKFTVEAGPLVRGQLRTLLRKADFDYNLNLDLQEEKRWLSSTFFVTMEGPEAVLVQVKK